jgi:glycosyltransferase involved in cell wall biosynthesis
LHAVEILRREFNIVLDGLPEPPLSMDFPPPAKSILSPEVLCLGAIGYFDPRKGVDLLCEAFRLARFNRPVKLLLAGKVNDPALEFQLKTGPGDREVQAVDKILSNEEYAAALEKMDILCLPYRSHVGPSAVYAQAAYQGKVIIASDYGWLGWEGKKYNKIVFFKDRDLASLIGRLEETVSKFDSLKNLTGNYVPNTEADFTKVFCSF